MTIYDVIKRPLRTEKTEINRATNNEYTFEVDRRANKIQIKEAVEKLFNVEVDGVNTLNIKPKNKRFRMAMYKTPLVKKAIVKLKEGNEIKGFDM